jgi:capsular polysaccharide biosynthesis protein
VGLYDSLRVIRDRWWMVLATLLAALGLASVVTARAEPEYAAQVTFLVTAPGEGVTDAYQGNLFLQQRVKSYVDLLTGDRLAQRVTADPGLELTADRFRERISARVERDTMLISATVTASDPRRARQLVDSLRARADIAITDTSPLLASTAPRVLGCVLNMVKESRVGAMDPVVVEPAGPADPVTPVQPVDPVGSVRAVTR